MKYLRIIFISVLNISLIYNSYSIMYNYCQIIIYLLNIKYSYDIIKIPRGYDIFSIKPTKDIKRGANIVYVLNTYHR